MTLDPSMELCDPDFGTFIKTTRAKPELVAPQSQSAA